MKKTILAKKRFRILPFCLLPALLLAGLGWAALRVRAPASKPAQPRAVTVTLARMNQAAEEQAAPISARSRRPYCYTVLLAGLDDAGGGSDTNLLLRIDVPLRQMDLVSLPRDTVLHHEWHSNKLNYAYASGGIELLRREIENLLGVPVDFFVTVDLRGFEKLVDGIGGIDFDVPADMDYDDGAQDLHIHFSKGPRHLNGREAMAVARWRKNNTGGGYADADVGRIRTQQALLKALAEKAVSLGSVPALVRLFFTCVHTDLSAGNLVWLGEQAMEIGMEGLRFHTLPGNGAGYYRGESVYVPDPDAALALVNEALNPYDTPLLPEELDILVP